MTQPTLNFSQPFHAAREKQLSDYHRYKVIRVSDNRRSYTDDLPKDMVKNLEYKIWDNFKKKEIN